MTREFHDTEIDLTDDEGLAVDTLAEFPLPEASSDAASKAGIEIVESRQPEGLGFNFKVPSTGRVLRLDAARDPAQPRFWCFRISRCGPSGTVDHEQRSWFGGDRMVREDLPAAIAAIRNAPDAWLSKPSSESLREWVFEAAAPEEVAAAAARAARTTRLTRGPADAERIGTKDVAG